MQSTDEASEAARRKRVPAMEINPVIRVKIFEKQQSMRKQLN
ncbi:hypothetical protein [Metabacillus sediminilitoris]|nr:hypothetical protein [Metabacillus sediminilitoris]